MSDDNVDDEGLYAASSDDPENDFEQKEENRGKRIIWIKKEATAQKAIRQVKAVKKPKSQTPSKGLKRRSLKKALKLDMPPTPVGCEWRETDGGWNLFRCWSERDEVLGGRYKKERYVGFLGKEAWQVMKQYDYETFISIIGQRFRRHSGR